MTNQYANATECIFGHKFDNANTYINPTSGARQCKICMKERAKAYYKSNKEIWNKNKIKDITHDHLKQNIEYDPNTGLWKWIVLPNNSCKKGWFAGHLKTNQDGYQLYEIRICGITYIAARLAWFYMKGEWPINKIDHKNRNSLDNKWDNIREATNSQNTMNQTPRFNQTGRKGVVKSGKKYSSYVKIDGTMMYLGTYNTAEEASLAYESVAKPLHGAFWYVPKMPEPDN